MAGLDLERFHAGDELLFEQLVREYSPRIRPYLRSYAGPDVDDLLQEVWLRVFRKRRTYEGRGSFIGWLLMVSRTVGLAAVSRRRREPLTEELRDSPGSGDPEAGILRQKLRSAVLSLPERQREVVILRLVEGRSTAETAERLGCAEGTVKATLHQATRRLQELLKEALI